MHNYDSNHFVYFDLVDNWMERSKFPFLIDWRLDDQGNFVTFTAQEIAQQVAVGIQRLPDPNHKSIAAVNMFDPASLSVTIYIANSCIPFTSTHGKLLKKLEMQHHLPTDASFFAIPGYDRMQFPFIMMEVSSKGEIYLINTKTWFRQLLLKLVQDHTEDCVGHHFFTYEPKKMIVSNIFCLY